MFASSPHKAEAACRAIAAGDEIDGANDDPMDAESVVFACRASMAVNRSASPTAKLLISVAVRSLTPLAANTNDLLELKAISARALASATLLISLEVSPRV